MMKKENDFIVWFDMDGTLYAFIYGGDYHQNLYFQNLPLHKEVAEAMEMLDGIHVNEGKTKLVCKILSSYLTPEMTTHDCLSEKNNALDRDTLVSIENRTFIPCGQSKWEEVCRLGLQNRSILIDDYGENLKDWKGPYVKVSKDASDMEKERKNHRFCISPESSSEEIMGTVLLAIEDYLKTATA